MDTDLDRTPGKILEIDDILQRLRCPKSHSTLERFESELRSTHGDHVYPIVRGVPDLRSAPKRLVIDLPWYEPWDDLDTLDLSEPAPHPAADLPYHLNAQLASVPGDHGDGRWVLEVGCGERHCEAYFAKRDFNYVGIDVDDRGPGPHFFADAHNLPIESESFDFYTSMAVYEHLVSPLQAALEAHRILKPGGVFFGSAAFVYGFHDRASFHHMTHGGLLWTFRMAGFEVQQIWSDWDYTQSIPEMAFGEGAGVPWRVVSGVMMKALDRTFVGASNLARRMVGKKLLERDRRRVERAGSLSFIVRKPAK